MYLSRKMKDGTVVGIIVHAQTEERLRNTCFRGVMVCRAGNFHCWNRSEQLFFIDGTILRKFLAEMAALWQKQSFGTHSVEICCDYFVGWSSTAPRRGYSLEMLEPFNLNGKGHGLRVKTHRTDLCAPQTKVFTIVFELKSEEGRPTAVIHSMYPGSDVGELDGDVSTRENCVFFDSEHPGQQQKT